MRVRGKAGDFGTARIRAFVIAREPQPEALSGGKSNILANGESHCGRIICLSNAGHLRIYTSPPQTLIFDLSSDSFTRSRNPLLTILLSFSCKPQSKYTSPEPVLELRAMLTTSTISKANVGVFTNPAHELWVAETTPTLEGVKSGTDLQEGEVTIGIKSTGICG